MVTNSHPLSGRTQRDAANMLYDNSFGGIVVSAAAGSILVFGFPNPAVIHLKYAWFAMIMACLILRFADALYWRIALVNSDFDGKRATQRFTAGCLVTAALWAWYVVAVFDHMGIIELASTFIIVSAMAGGAATVLAANKFASVSYAAILLVPISICGILHDEQYRQMLGILGGLFAVVMILTTLKASEYTKEAIRLKNENADLLVQMGIEKQAVKDANDSLEEKVKDRTLKIYELSNIDPLTGLFNRKAFSKQLKYLLAKHDAEKESLALLFVDLDGFKGINDSQGHKVGDLVLSEISRRITVFADERHNICRWGGDEFLVALTNTDEETAANLAKQLISELSQPIKTDFEPLTIGATIGIAMYPKHGDSEEQLIKLADTAMYVQKKTSKSEAVVFSQEMMETLEREQHLREGLALAIPNKQMHLVYQPIIEAKTGKIASLEALLRWQFGDELILPNEFVPVAEQYGFIKDIGAWAVNRACQKASKWSSDHPFSVNVNVSVIQLMDKHFETIINHALTASGLDPERLHIEVTESVFAEKYRRLRRNVKTTQNRGIKVLIDDFGTGYSSLSQLQILGVNAIKIDRSFVRNMQKGGETIIEATLQIAKSLNYAVVAEGVETAAQAERLTELGVDYLQGFYFSKPMTEEGLNLWLEEIPDLA